MGLAITSGRVAGGIWSIISSGTGACDITAIPTGFKILRLQVISATAGTIKFNNDGGNNYWYSHGRGAVQAAQTTSIQVDSAVGNLSCWTAEISNLATTEKQVAGMSCRHTGGVTNDEDIPFCGTWGNTTDEINRITVSGTPVFWALYGCGGL